MNILSKVTACTIGTATKINENSEAYIILCNQVVHYFTRHFEFKFPIPDPGA
jgi:hypothetical protein